MKINFYILENHNSQQANFFACRWLEKYYQEHKKPVFVQMNSLEEAQRFDQLLWIYRDDSFLPHQVYPANDQAPILIGYGEHAPAHHTILVNFGKEIPAFFQQCEEIMEMISGDALMQQSARERYKYYRSLGHDINTIKVNQHD